jgi:hypothetical protein
MAMKRPLIAVFAILICLMFAWATGAGRPYPANAGGVIDPSCTSSLPCIEYDNNGTGPGIRGISVSGNGLAGATKFNSTSLSNSREGLIGNDISTSGTFNAGVRGLSTRGFGVAGQSTSGVGVQGITSSASNLLGGVLGIGSAGAGVLGEGHFAVEGSDNNTGGDNIFANGTGGNLFRGNNSAGIDVFKVTDAGDITVGRNINIASDAMIDGNAYVTRGISAGSVLSDLVSANNSGSPTAFQASSSDPSAALYDGFSSLGHEVFLVDDAGNVHAHSFTADFAAAQSTSSGPPLPTYASEASVPTIEDFGEATLLAGSGYVKLNPRFASAMAPTATYLVFITPQGPTRNSLYVTQKTRAGFEVRENYPGQETVTFDYRIVAKPYAAQAQQSQTLLRVPYVPRVPITHKLILQKTHDVKPGR